MAGGEYRGCMPSVEDSFIYGSDGGGGGREEFGWICGRERPGLRAGNAVGFGGNRDRQKNSSCGTFHPRLTAQGIHFF